VIRSPFKKNRAKRTVYEGGINVPLIVKGPSISAPDQDRHQLVHVVDLFPTIAELAGVEFSHKIDGVSFMPALREATSKGRSVVYADWFKPNGPPPYNVEERSVRSQHWKLIRRFSIKKDKTDFEAEEFFAMTSGAIDEGFNLLDKPLRPEAKAGYQFLVAEFDRISAELAYEGPRPEPAEPTPPTEQ
jgi:arylsulfatase A-like enzyme